MKTPPATTAPSRQRRRRRKRRSQCCCCCCSPYPCRTSVQLILLLTIAILTRLERSFGFRPAGCIRRRHTQPSATPVSSLLLPLAATDSSSSSIGSGGSSSRSGKDVADADRDGGGVDGEKTQRRTRTKKQPRPGSMAAATAEMGRVPYGESSRKYRRTVYTHADWIVHRSSDRLLQNLRGMFFSGIVRQLKPEITLVSVVSTFVVLWNLYLVPSVGLWEFTLPTLPFTLCSSALGLLLVFRTNAAYARWLEARSTWARVATQCCNVVRMALTFLDRKRGDSANNTENDDGIDRLIRTSYGFCRSLMNSVMGSDDDEDYERDLRRFVVSADRDKYYIRFTNRLLDAPDRAGAALMEFSRAVDDLAIDEKRRVEIDKSLVILGDCVGACDRIFTSPIPLVYTRHTARFLTLYMVLLPFAVYKDLSGWSLVPAMAILSLFLFGIERLSVELEEPFSILPLSRICESVQDTTSRYREWFFNDDADDAAREEEDYAKMQAS